VRVLNSVKSDRLQIVPITQREANAWIDEEHRHLSHPRGDVIRVSLEFMGVRCGVATAGRPVARMLQDGRTLEITRVAVYEGLENGCSMMYGALRAAGRALGFTRIVTYIREDEPGTSLRAAGFRCDGVAGGGEWSRPSRGRRAAEQPITKVRYVWP
jgi:hypothetical protein